MLSKGCHDGCHEYATPIDAVSGSCAGADGMREHGAIGHESGHDSGHDASSDRGGDVVGSRCAGNCRANPARGAPTGQPAARR